jgi:hypothetical protein
MDGVVDLKGKAYTRWCYWGFNCMNMGMIENKIG